MSANNVNIGIAGSAVNPLGEIFTCLFVWREELTARPPQRAGGVQRPIRMPTGSSQKVRN
jgi:hypothetical protein